MAQTGFDSLKLLTGLDAPNISAQALDTLDFFIPGAQTVAALKGAHLAGFAGTIVGVRARALTAPVGSAMILDVKKNGTTIFTTAANRPTIADGQTVSTLTLPDIVAIAAGDYISVDVAQIGSGTAGSDLLVSITVKRALV